MPDSALTATAVSALLGIWRSQELGVVRNSALLGIQRR
jgi:hypothetical protein